MIPKGRRATTLRHVRAFFSLSLFVFIFIFHVDFACYVFSWRKAESTVHQPSDHCECRFGASEILVYFSFHAISVLFSTRNRFCRVQLGRKLNLLYFFSSSLSPDMCVCVWLATKQIKIHKIISSHQSSSSPLSSLLTEEWQQLKRNRFTRRKILYFSHVSEFCGVCVFSEFSIFTAYWHEMPDCCCLCDCDIVCDYWRCTCHAYLSLSPLPHRYGVLVCSSRLQCQSFFRSRFGFSSMRLQNI